MNSTYGKNIKVTVFGAGHAPEIGVTVEGLPAGESVDLQQLQTFLERRAPGRDDLSTARREPDVPGFLSGLTDGKTDGKILKAVIRNRDARPQDYKAIADTPRPGHADYPARVKYGEDLDMAGGGPFSGRMTAPLCVAGGIALQILARKGITIRAEVVSAGGVSGSADVMRAAVKAAKEEGDSVGGIVECTAEGVPAGIGGPLFGGLESRIAEIVYGIPAVKGVDFGAGFSVAYMAGSENNDPFEIQGGRVVTRTNNCGGILGGISTGMPIVFRAAFKPTPSIAKEQDTVNLRTMENVKISVPGRHDPCIVFRAAPVVEAAAALAILDAMAEPAETADLAGYRQKMDAINAQMLRLFEQRMELSAQIAKIKKEQYLPVFYAVR
ncbi:MAG: chorismate synthase [Firmicutes bacterium]|nr:chorismate synthase [Bacillota bacterium]